MNLPLLVLALTSAPAGAAELVWDGFYRSRAQLYDSLSLSDTNEYSEGVSASLDHRFSLRPAWHLSDRASLHAQVELLPFAVWGDEPAVGEDPVTGELTANATADGVTQSGAGLRATRAWGEASFQAGESGWLTVSAGRLPMQWGAGILWNPGDEPDDEYGDTADRVQLAGNFGQVWLLGAWDVQYEGFLGAEDDMQSASLGLGYLTESSGFALLNNYRYQPEYQWNAYTGDLWGRVHLGPIELELEAVARFAGGDLETGANGISESAFGAMLDAHYRADPLTLGLQAGFASGDSDPDDTSLHTFAFDPDHDVGVLLFEEYLPTLSTQVLNEANQGRTYEAAVTGDGVSNALYLKPSVRYAPRDFVSGEVAWLMATQARAASATPGGYGHEFDLTLRLDPHPHVWFQGTVGLLLPGKRYSEYESEDYGGGFEAPAVGVKAYGTVEF